MGIEKLEDKALKQQKIVEMFDNIADTYDLANRVLSMGIDISWRKKGCDKAFELLHTNSVERIVDVATGTGDLLLMWKERAAKRGVDIKRFTGVDPSKGMLDVARKKVDFADFIEAKAQQLPIEDASADIVSIAYGIRNVVDREKALREFYRILRPGGLAVILEFTKQDRNGLIDKAVDFGMKKVLPRIGGLISKNYEAYKYLPDSIEAFLTAEMLSEELEAAGFTMRYVTSFSMGISTLLLAQKI